MNHWYGMLLAVAYDYRDIDWDTVEDELSYGSRRIVRGFNDYNRWRGKLN